MWRVKKIHHRPGFIKKKLPRMDLIVNPFLVHKIISGTKCASMIQNDFKLGEQLNLFYHPELNNSTKLFAVGKIVAGIGLKVTPEIEKIEQWNGLKWIELTKNQVKKVLQNEGVHPDDFFKRHKETYEVNQIYFDIIKTHI